ncbi:MAG: 3-keto-disaccharide hydrolase [Gemmatimonadota bacterium]
MTLRRPVRLLVPLLALGPLACASSDTPDDGEPSAATDRAHDTLSEAEREAGWRLLFDGESLAGWRGYETEMPPDGWRAEEGTLYRYGSGGDLVTVDRFSDFELALEWRVEEGGNSGIFYRAAPGSEHIFHSAPEFQVLDDAGHADGENPLTSAGSVYAIYPAPRGVVRPAGEWNEVRIVARGNHVEHWMNGEKIVEYEFGSDDWEARVADSKFADVEEYGAASEGHIGLQDHGDPVWFRNVKLRPLEDGAGGADS